MPPELTPPGPPGGTPTGGGNPHDGKGDAPKPLTVEDVTRIVNSAITARDKRRDEKIPDQLAEALKPFAEKLEKFSAPPAAPPSPGKKKDDPTAQEISELRTRLERAEQKADKERTERELILKDQRDRGATSVLAEALTGGGVNTGLAKTLAASLYGKGVVRYEGDDSDNVVIVLDDQELALKAGVPKWLKTDEGRHWLPPAPPGGSGAGRGKPGTSVADGQKLTHQDVSEAMVDAFG